MRWMTMLVVVAACRGTEGDGGGAHVGVEDGANGAAGPAGLTGPAGPAGPSGATYAWFDALGEQVTEGSELVYFDAQQNVWSIDADSADLVGDATVRYYEGPDCDGASHLLGAIPRFVISGAAWGEVGTFYVRPDDAESVDACVESWSAGGACLQVQPTCDKLTPFADLEQVQVPAAPAWAAPLHPEPI